MDVVPKLLKIQRLGRGRKQTFCMSMYYYIIIYNSGYYIMVITNTSLAAPVALAHRIQHFTACKIQNGREGAIKWQMGSGKESLSASITS